LKNNEWGAEMAKNKGSGLVQAVLLMLLGILLVAGNLYPLPGEVTCSGVKLPVNYEIYNNYDSLGYLSGWSHGDKTDEIAYIGRLRANGWYPCIDHKLFKKIAGDQLVKIVPVPGYRLSSSPSLDYFFYGQVNGVLIGMIAYESLAPYVPEGEIGSLVIFRTVIFRDGVFYLVPHINPFLLPTGIICIVFSAILLIIWRLVRRRHA